MDIKITGIRVSNDKYADYMVFGLDDIYTVSIHKASKRADGVLEYHTRYGTFRQVNILGDVAEAWRQYGYFKLHKINVVNCRNIKYVDDLVDDLRAYFDNGTHAKIARSSLNLIDKYRSADIPNCRVSVYRVGEKGVNYSHINISNINYISKSPSGELEYHTSNGLFYPLHSLGDVRESWGNHGFASLDTVNVVNVNNIVEIQKRRFGERLAIFPDGSTTSIARSKMSLVKHIPIRTI